MGNVPVHTILTHINPDLDAILSVLLLKRFGEKLFPGSASAEISFCSAAQLPDDKSPDELEQDGILAVDVGGGRFDTHPKQNKLNPKKQNRCAADLVAETLGVSDKPQWRGLIEFTRQHDAEARNIQSTDYLHHLPTLLTILSGLSIIYEDTPDKSIKLLNQGIQILTAIPAHFDCNTEFDSYSFINETVNQYLCMKNVDITDPPPEYENFTKWFERLTKDPDNAFSRNILDKLVSLHTIAEGFWVLKKGDVPLVRQELYMCFDAIIARQANWINALADFNRNGQIIKLRRNIHLASIASKNGLVIKASRFRRRIDITIFRDDKTGGTTLILNRRGPLKQFAIRDLAAAVRTAECFEWSDTPKLTDIYKIGMVHGWFVHQSQNLLIRGSPKTNDFIPSRISLDCLTAITASSIDWHKKLPDRYCPENRCTLSDCIFYKLQLMTCKNHRNKCKQSKKNDSPLYPNRIQPQSDFGKKLRDALHQKSKKK